MSSEYAIRLGDICFDFLFGSKVTLILLEKSFSPINPPTTITGTAKMIISIQPVTVFGQMPLIRAAGTPNRNVTAM